MTAAKNASRSTCVRGAVWAILVLLLQTSACVIHEREYAVYGHGRGHASNGCPPGHVWSDGQCHEHGKGHDPNKHARKDD